MGEQTFQELELVVVRYSILELLLGVVSEADLFSLGRVVDFYIGVVE